MALTRRHFIEGSVATIGLAATSSALADKAKGPDLVDVSGKDPKAMVKAALEGLGGIGRFVKKGDYVVIKANAGFANPPDWATTTHPDTVLAVAEACLAAGAKRVMVVEHPVAKGKRPLDRCGLNEAMKKLPAVQVKELTSQDDFKTVTVKGGVALKETAVAKPVLSADVFINIPAAKAHGATSVSFGLKNAMGVIWERRPFHTHLDIHQAVADLGRAVRPNLTILDATRVLLTNGPAGPGDTVQAGRIIAGAQIASVDAYGLTLGKFDGRTLTPAEVRHIALAKVAGLGETDIAKLVVKKLTA